MFSITYTDRRQLTAQFEKMPEKLHDALLRSMTGLADDLKAHIASDKLNGQVLKRITGRLAGSIQRRIEDSPNKITATVYSNDTAKPYNAVHEYGLMIPERIAKGKAMRFMVGGEVVFAKRCRAFKMPERSYMRSGLDDFKPKIIQTLEATVKKAVS